MGQFAWAGLSPDGTYLFSNAGAQSGATTAFYSGLYTVPGSSAITTTGLPALEATLPAFSFDANHVAFNFYAGSSTPSTLPGTFNVSHGSNSVTASLTQSVLAAGSVLTFASQPGSTYSVSSISGTTITLSAAYSGTSTAATTATFSASGDQSSLAAIDYANSTKAFSNFRVLATPGRGSVPSGGHIYYPSYLPSNNQLVWELESTYNGRDVAGTRSQCDQRGPVACQNDGTHAELWWTDVATGLSAPLTNLNGGSSDTSTYLPAHSTANDPNGDWTLNYEPTVDPQKVGGYEWVVFTSRRQYGNIATVNPFWSDPRYENISQQPTTKKLWFAALNPNAAPGTDPSYPAFYVQGQELLAGNSRGYWVAAACTPAGTSSANVCSTNADCCSPNVCVEAQGSTTSYCSATTTPTCTAAAASCTTSAQCCLFPNYACINNTCQVPTAAATYTPLTFSIVYDGTQCPSGTRVSWIDVGVEALTPTGTDGTSSSIGIGVQVSTNDVTFTPTTPVSVGTLKAPPVNQSLAWTNFPLSPPLASISGSADSDNYIDVTFTMNPSTDRTVVPTITNWRARFDCVPSE